MVLLASGFFSATKQIPVLRTSPRCEVYYYYYLLSKFFAPLTLVIAAI